MGNRFTYIPMITGVVSALFVVSGTVAVYGAPHSMSEAVDAIDAVTNSYSSISFQM